MKTREITVSVTLDWTPLIEQLEALAQHARTLASHAGDDVDANRAMPPHAPATAPESPEPVTEEPAVGEQVTDRDGTVWQRFEDGWRWWRGESGGWTSWLRTWDYVQNFGPIRVTTDDDRRRVGLPVCDEDASPEPVEAAETAAQPEDESVDPETENGPENGVQGRIGWLRVKPGAERRYLMREVTGGWADTDIAADAWDAENYPDAEFTPIRTLAADEVAVKREEEIGPEHVHYLRSVAFDLEDDGDLDSAKVIRAYADALEAGR